MIFIGACYLFQVVYESFVEDINGILNTGDLPNLYQSDEKGVILDAMQTISKQQVRIIENIRLQDDNSHFAWFCLNNSFQSVDLRQSKEYSLKQRRGEKL